MAGDAIASLPSSPGSYALVFSLAERRAVRVGALGSVVLKPGFVIYVGSAFGPGGLRARVSRHARIEKPLHWHIDYLRCHLELEEAWLTTFVERREHEWAGRLGGRLEIAAARFGASDCRCASHLFHTAARPVATIVGGDEDIIVWRPQPSM